jgi:hypothetical protein
VPTHFTDQLVLPRSCEHDAKIPEAEPASSLVIKIKGSAGKVLHARQTAAPLLYRENSIPHFVF